MLNNRTIIILGLAVILAGVVLGVFLSENNYTKKAPASVPVINVGTSNLPPHIPSVPPKFLPVLEPYRVGTSTQSENPYYTAGEHAELSFPENTLDTSDWLTFRSENLGFEIKHPKDWNVMEYGYDKEFPTLGENGEILSLGSISIYPKNKLEAKPNYKAGVSVYISKKSKEQIKSDRQKLQEKILAGEITDNKGYQVYQMAEIIMGKWTPIGTYFVSTDTMYYTIIEKGNPLIFQKILLSFKPLKQ